MSKNPKAKPQTLGQTLTPKEAEDLIGIPVRQPKPEQEPQAIDIVEKSLLPSAEAPTQALEPKKPARKKLKQVADVQQLARKHTRSAIRELSRVLKSDKSNAFAKIRAAEVLLNRGWGQPKSTLDITEKLGGRALEIAAQKILLRRAEALKLEAAGPTVVDGQILEVKNLKTLKS